ncbi:MAG: MalY/PatB family protein [Bacillota bacterium]|jgi:cystathionine beta-lyase|nr:pyridoxal phosphate-dependent aminotransferase [Eubacteriales bacterium]MDD4286145.1 pyridoxal phosphate-dependent aminotransferase [Eubacteriales bacterium]MDI9491432.1 MalY/PatB family protein [Bacillota bacterium]NLV70096.1 pyridoxal phosphate-dependent aminotransferase [Clostridiales bacterium]
MERFDFDTPVNRKGTLSYKWDSQARNLGESDVLPMWVADMDFRCPQPMLDALQERIEHGVLGYTKRGDRYYEIMQNWLSRRFDWTVDTQWLCYCPPGVIPAVTILLDILTKPGDPVLMHMPNYDALYGAVKEMGRSLIRCPLLEDEDGFRIDFDLFEKLLREYKIKVMLFCSPHNPSGRVWTGEELEQTGALCARYGVTVISDEVHCDLVYKPHIHTPFGKIKSMEQNSVTLMSPNKTFNVGGLMTASVIIPDPALMARYRKVLGTWAMNLDTTFGTIAVETLYRDPDCEAWLDAVVEYLRKNAEYATEWINTRIPGVRTRCPEGTYLLWLDFADTGLQGPELYEFLIRKAHLDLSEGSEFDPEDRTHMRMNLACPRATLREALGRLEAAVNSRTAK